MKPERFEKIKKERNLNKTFLKCHTDAEQLISNCSVDAHKVKSYNNRFLRTVLVSAGRGAVFATLKPEGLHTFRGRLAEVLRAVEALDDLIHVVIAGLHRLAFQGKLILHVLHHLNRKPLDLIKCHHKNDTNSRRAQMSGAVPCNAIIRQWS